MHVQKVIRGRQVRYLVITPRDHAFAVRQGRQARRQALTLTLTRRGSSWGSTYRRRAAHIVVADPASGMTPNSRKGVAPPPSSNAGPPSPNGSAGRAVTIWSRCPRLATPWIGRGSARVEFTYSYVVFYGARFYPFCVQAPCHAKLAQIVDRNLRGIPGRHRITTDWGLAATTL